MDEFKEEVELENEDNTSKNEVEVQQENTKTYSQEELDAKIKEINENNQKAWNKRWGQEKSKMEREFERKQDVLDLFMQQTKTKNIEELMDVACKEYGVEKPVSKASQRDEERLGKLDAQDMLELDIDSIIAEANRLSGLNRTPRENAMFMELGAYLTKKQSEDKRKQEIKENGFDEDIVESEDFKEFSKKFAKETSLKDIYDIYSKSSGKTKQKPFSPGSATGKSLVEESDTFTVEEFNALTEEDLKDDKIYEKAMKTMQKLN